MFRNTNVPNLWTDNRAAIAVEFAIISCLLLLFLLFFSDLVMRQALTGKLDRVSYSVAGILRERVELYEAREYLNQQDVDEATLLVRKMLTDMHVDADLSEMKLIVEELHFMEPINLNDTSKTIKTYNSWQSSAGYGNCQPPQPLNQLMQLTPKGSYGRWVPLYQVTVCLPAISWFTRLITAAGQRPIMSSFAIVILR